MESHSFRFSRELWEERRTSSIDPEDKIGVIVDTVLEYDAVAEADIQPSDEVMTEIESIMTRAELVLTPEEMDIARDIITQVRIERAQSELV